jgi:hypothetical protein
MLLGEQANLPTIAGLLCGLVIGVAIATVIGAVIFRAACWLFNKFAGGAGAPGAIPEPDFGRAMLSGAVRGGPSGAGALSRRLTPTPLLEVC